MPFLLQRIGIVGGSYYLNFVRDQLPVLSFTLRRNQRATRGDGCSSCEALHGRIIRQGVLRDDL